MLRVYVKYLYEVDVTYFIHLQLWCGHSIYKILPVNVVYVDITVAYELIFDDKFQCGIYWSINNSLDPPHSICLLIPSLVNYNFLP